MNSELKPCPWCGESAQLDHTNAGDGHEVWQASCVNEECKFVNLFYSSWWRDDVVSVWNTRAQPTTPAEPDVKLLGLVMQGGKFLSFPPEIPVSVNGITETYYRQKPAEVVSEDLNELIAKAMHEALREPKGHSWELAGEYLRKKRKRAAAAALGALIAAGIIKGAV